MLDDEGELLKEGDPICMPSIQMGLGVDVLEGCMAVMKNKFLVDHIQPLVLKRLHNSIKLQVI